MMVTTAFNGGIASSSRSLLNSTITARISLRRVITVATIPRFTAAASVRKLSTTSNVRNAGTQVDAKISTIVDQIEKLTLLEASDLVSQLKTRLNITEIAMPTATVSAGATSTTGAGADGAQEAQEESAKPKEKTVFTVKLAGLKDPTAKAKVIREVKSANSTMNLVEAKKFVESTPQVLKEGLNKEDAEKLKAAIEAAGGVVELE
ncbi:related to 60S ribosomal protein L12, mitochondrial [Melanopsichium pennsylvanicum]|uniref:Related to 60S ribosomal protein L12, mitochondrial n=2 Tax=Melanopsichium pennsylvanicum TaxID=63383 RepID=A0AAJ4XPY3_9BASI|nr:related to 60S ribosomal protein L12, mitochondrial [Melanopsichium pennsylvanicum 4]SNX86365.1 related to 60S ribosomal protein L12, mitochondrial [Melanopsichium pennsylvanicum]